MIVRRTIVIDASPEVIFDALTDPDQIVQAYPLTSAETDPQIGGTLTLRGHTPEGPFTDHGTIEAFDRPARLRYRYWSTNHGTERTPENHMSIDYRLVVVEGSTRVELEHKNLLTEARREMMGSAWDFLLGELKRYSEAASDGSA